MDKEEEFTKTFRHFNQGAFMSIAFPDQPFFGRVAAAAECSRGASLAISSLRAFNDLNPGLCHVDSRKSRRLSALVGNDFSASALSDNAFCHSSKTK